jgi:hypothetical protein
VDVTDGKGCFASDTIKLVIYGTIHLDFGRDTTVCGCILLNAYVTGATSYLWCSGGTYPAKNVCTTGDYCVTVSNGVCTVSDTIHITVLQPPVVHLGKDTTVKATLVLNAGNTGASFLWSTGATTQTIDVTSSGQYDVVVTAANGCTASDTINVNVISGIAENTNTAFHVNVYPNPSNSSNFMLNFDIEERGNVEIKILSTLGLVVYSENLENFQGEYQKKIRIENFAPGIYFADILKGDKRSTIKLSFE